MILPNHAQRGPKLGRQPEWGVESVLVRKRRATFLPAACHRHCDLLAPSDFLTPASCSADARETLYNMPDVVYVFCCRRFHSSS